MSDSRGAALPVCFVSSHANLGGAELYLESLLGELGPGWDRAGRRAGRRAVRGAAASVRLPCRRRAVRPAPEPVDGERSGSTGLLRRWGARLVHANGVKAALTVCALAARGTRLPGALAQARLGARRARRTVDEQRGAATSSPALARRCWRRSPAPVGCAPRSSPTGSRPTRCSDPVHARPSSRSSTRAPPAGRSRWSAVCIRARASSELVGDRARAARRRLSDLRLVFVGSPDPYKPG